ncbi:translation initiation factor If-2 [Mycobacterium intracellulare]|nr:translation initiation factor If-2 [Mycobacterium intracellulare]
MRRLAGSGRLRLPWRRRRRAGGAGPVAPGVARRGAGGLGGGGGRRATGLGRRRGRFAVAGGFVDRVVEGRVERLVGALAAALASPFAAFAGAFSAAGLPPPKDSRSRRATGASTVDDADLTNSP